MGDGTQTNGWKLKGKVVLYSSENTWNNLEGGKSELQKKQRLKFIAFPPRQNKPTTAFVRNVNKAGPGVQLGNCNANCTPTSGDLFRSGCLQSRCFFTSLEGSRRPPFNSVTDVSLPRMVKSSSKGLLVTAPLLPPNSRKYSVICLAGVKERRQQPEHSPCEVYTTVPPFFPEQR